MRISDWSSDVCSSDLGGGFGRALAGNDIAQIVSSAASEPDRIERTNLALDGDLRLSDIEFQLTTRGDGREILTLAAIEDDLLAIRALDLAIDERPRVELDQPLLTDNGIGETMPSAKDEPDAVHPDIAERDQIGRAHAELQSLMRISYAVF